MNICRKGRISVEGCDGEVSDDGAKDEVTSRRSTSHVSIIKVAAKWQSESNSQYFYSHSTSMNAINGVLPST